MTEEFWKDIKGYGRLNLSSGNICKCLKGKSRQLGGYVFEYSK